jgi:predicted anti-sigma-YlaC factor YlaD
MKCEEIRDLLPDVLDGEITAADRGLFEAHIAVCPACAEEFRRLNETWTRLGLLAAERPSPALSERFYASLEAEKKKRTRPSLTGAWAALRLRPAFRFGAALLLVAAGLSGGIWIGSRGNAGDRIVALGREVQDMRQTMAETLLRQSSSSERIQGVGYMEKVQSPGRRTIDALLQTLDGDPSVNVRLAAADALYLFAGQPGVKEGVIRSLAGQVSPSVQVALIDLLVDMRERRAVEALKLLAGNAALNPDVRKKAELGIRQLM